MVPPTDCVSSLARLVALIVFPRSDCVSSLVFPRFHCLCFCQEDDAHLRDEALQLPNETSGGNGFDPPLQDETAALQWNQHPRAHTGKTLVGHVISLEISVPSLVRSLNQSINQFQTVLV